jgi:hypothetical protein
MPKGKGYGGGKKMAMAPRPPKKKTPKTPKKPKKGGRKSPFKA